MFAFENREFWLVGVRKSHPEAGLTKGFSLGSGTQLWLEVPDGLIVGLVWGFFSRAAEALYHLAHEPNTILITKVTFHCRWMRGGKAGAFDSN